jgi:hypothetical protein
MITLSNFVSKRISNHTKTIILEFIRRFTLQNIRFFFVLGAVPKDKPKFIETFLEQPSNDLDHRIQLIKKVVDEANSKKYWPVRMRLRFLDGMSGQSYRHVLNGILKASSNYLEIGTWKGSTACAALDGNHLNAWIIDDWSEFGGPAKAALKNIAKFVGSSRLTIISEDFKTVDYKALIPGPIDTYLFDGPHAQEDHVLGTKVIDSLRFQTLVFIVDDWNWQDVRDGTLLGLSEIRATVVYKLEIFPRAKSRFQFSRWHNGYCFFVLENSKDLSVTGK